MNFPYINCSKYKRCFSTHFVVVDYYIHFCTFYLTILCLLQSQKNRKQKNTVWRSKNSHDHNNSNKHVQLSIASHFPDTVNFLKFISLKPFITQREREVEQVLFTMRGNGSLGSWSHMTIHSPSRCRNSDGKSSEEEVIEVSLGE